MDTTVSVIVPAYNVEDYLPRCLDSLLAQTFRDFELILVDDGSTDTTGAICDRYGETDARVRVLHQANAGVSAARNRALEIASGAFITFVDADDTVYRYAGHRRGYCLGELAGHKRQERL